MTARAYSPVPLTGLILDGRGDNSGVLTVKVVPAG
jgi:hypothetical protein